MADIFRNFIAGAITDNPLSSSATVINASVFSSLPVISAPDVMRLTLDPEATAGAPEIVIVTAHTSGSTAVTVLRGQDGTVARSHAQGTIVRHDIVRANAEGWLTDTAGSVDGTNIADNSITNAKMADNSVNTAELVNGAVTAAKIAVGTITQLELGEASVATDEIADGSVTYVKLNADVKANLIQTGTFTPTLGGMAIGTGGGATNTARYTWLGGPSTGDEGILLVEGFIIFGTTGATFPGATITVAPPSGFNFPSPLSQETPCGRVIFGDAGTSSFTGFVRHHTTTAVRFVVETVNATYGFAGATGTTIPMTWAAGDFITYQYEMRAVRA